MNEERSIDHEYKVNYGMGIQSRLLKIHNAIENNKSATNEFENLIVYLTSDILDPIRKDLKSITLKYNERIQSVRTNPYYPTTTYNWSGRHKSQYLGNIIRRLQTDAIQELLSVIMDRLSVMGYLGKDKKSAQI